MKNILDTIVKVILNFLMVKKPLPPVDVSNPPPAEKIAVVPPAPVTPIFVPKNEWDIENKSDKWSDYPIEKKARLIVKTREICMEQGLGMQATQQLLQTIMGESGFNVFCENKNTFDFGVAQFNQRTYLVEYKMTPEDALSDPIRCITIMAKNWPIRKTNWVAFSSGGYKNYDGWSDEKLAGFMPKWYSY